MTLVNVGFRKVGTGLASMTWLEPVDDAMCFGWIDAARMHFESVAPVYCLAIHPPYV